MTIGKILYETNLFAYVKLAQLCRVKKENKKVDNIKEEKINYKKLMEEGHTYKKVQGRVKQIR